MSRSPRAAGTRPSRMTPGATGRLRRRSRSKPPSGVYQARVVASDGKDNPAEEALTGERVSGPFVVSHTPPEVILKVPGMDGDRAVIEATATDPFVRLTSASFSVNGKKWVNVFP